MTKDDIVKLAIENDVVEEVYGALHSVIVAKLRSLRNRVVSAESDLWLLKKFAAANRLDVIKTILEESEADE